MNTPDLSQEFHPVPKVYRDRKQAKPIKKIGKKGKLNIEATAELKKTAATLGIKRCEIALHGCWKDIHGFAHGKKKSKGMTPTELRKFAIAGCNHCHYKIEYECEKWTGMTMEQFVRMTIKNRKTKK